MASIFVTGDIHGDPISRLSKKVFNKQKLMTDGQESNFVIICGDFGLVWDQVAESKEERYLLNWLEQQPFTTLFVSGNHENFDRLYSSEYPIEEWCGGRVQKIRKHVIHLMRGEYYNILGKTFFTFGGAQSHDIQDGILDPNDKQTIKEWNKDYNKMFRINHVSWWEQELASDEEMTYGLAKLKEHDNKVDFIITHCLPQQIISGMFLGAYGCDKMTKYLDQINEVTQFSQWYAGHYHLDERYLSKYQVLYHQIIQIA